MTERPAIITLLTDFGEDDGYVGAMKGVMLGILPDAQLVDISHHIAPQSVRQAALILANVYPYFPPHTVHLVVIDPGVGGARRAIAVQAPGGRFVAPDNGVLTEVLLQEPEAEIVALENPTYWRSAPSHTFHGRDIFSPVAAHLASGVALKKLGPPIEEPVILPPPSLSISAASIQGEITHIDHFGNVLTNIKHLRWIDEHTVEFQPTSGEAGQDRPRLMDAQKIRVTCGWHTLDGLRQTYSQVEVGQMAALVGSGGELEIAVNQGKASEALAAKTGDPITLYLSP